MANGNLKLGGGAAAALLALLVVFTGPREGVRTTPYFDPGGIPTVCFGETHVEMRQYTIDECKAMFAKSLAEYGKHVEACITEAMSVETEAAFIDTAYNAGWPGFCASPAAKLYNAGRHREACSALIGWHVSQWIDGKPVVLPGLVQRRKDAAALCLRGLAS